MSLDLVGLPCEIRFKIFDHVSVADLTKWLKIQKLRDSILAFLEDEGMFFHFEKSLWSVTSVLVHFAPLSVDVLFGRFTDCGELEWTKGER